MSNTEPIDNKTLNALISAVYSTTQDQKSQTSRLLDDVQEIKDTVRLLAERQLRIEHTIERHETMLRGNGKPGLVEVVNHMNPHVEEHERLLRGEKDGHGLVSRVKTLESRSEALTRPLWIVLTALLSTGVTLALTFLVK